MWFMLFFVSTVGAFMTIAALVQGNSTELIMIGPVTAIAGVFLWRNLRDPEVSRANGLRATIHFTFDPGDGVHRKGTFPRVHPLGSAWNLGLDRTPARGDLDMLEMPRRGWVWLNAANLPERVKTTCGSRWRTWRIASAANAENTKGIFP